MKVKSTILLFTGCHLLCEFYHVDCRVLFLVTSTFLLSVLGLLGSTIFFFPIDVGGDPAGELSTAQHAFNYASNKRSAICVLGSPSFAHIGKSVSDGCLIQDPVLILVLYGLLETVGGLPEERLKHLVVNKMQHINEAVLTLP